VIDEEGYLNITGRTKDVIIRGGENIPVAYIENVLYEHPAITGTALVGIPDPRLQERACAVVTLAEGSEPFGLEQMQAFLKEKGVARQYWPERVEVVEELPRTASGKIQKFRLREQIGDGT
jgi:cyclohexanecarboxylate-CoA ligase